jgi:hypothetical protein
MVEHESDDDKTHDYDDDDDDDKTHDYDVSEEEVEVEVCVTPDCVQVGSRFLVLDRVGHWLVAKVVRIVPAGQVDEHGRVLMHFHGWNKRHDEWFYLEESALDSCFRFLPA